MSDIFQKKYNQIKENAVTREDTPESNVRIPNNNASRKPTENEGKKEEKSEDRIDKGRNDDDNSDTEEAESNDEVEGNEDEETTSKNPFRKSTQNTENDQDDREQRESGKSNSILLTDLPQLFQSWTNLQKKNFLTKRIQKIEEKIQTADPNSAYYLKLQKKIKKKKKKKKIFNFFFISFLNKMLLLQLNYKKILSIYFLKEQNLQHKMQKQTLKYLE